MIIRQIWLTVAVVVLLIGIGARQPSIAAVGVLILFTGGLAKLWNRVSLERVTYQRTLPAKRAFVGETLEVGFSVVNRKSVPLPWIEIRENAPQAMPVEGAHAAPSSTPGAVNLVRTIALAWYERVGWRHAFRCEARGYYHFGPALLRSGDLFGFFESRHEVSGFDYVTVLPRLHDLSALGLPPRRPFGAERGGSPLFEDPSRLIGIRDYRAGDPLKRIEWKATARRGSLQSRVYEPSSSLHLVLALNVSTLEHVWEGYDPVKLERAISVTGSVARWALEHRYSVGLLANSSYPGADRAMAIATGRDPEQITRILEALAMISPFTIAPLNDVVDEAARRLPLGATIVLVAAYCSERLAATALRLHQRGHPLVLLWVADDAPPESASALPLVDISPRLRELEREAAQHDFAPARDTAAGA